MNKKNNIYIIIAVLILCIQLFSIFYNIKFHFSPIILVLNIFLLLLYSIICFFLIAQNLKILKLMEKNESLQNYNNTLSNLYDNIKAFKHDFNNIIYTIGGFISNNDIINLKKYYDNLFEDCQNVNNMAILDPKIINNSGIYNLLIIKLKKAKEANVKVSLETFLDFGKLHMPIYEFSRLLGILIDNSIEAASSSIEKNLNIVFRDSTSNHTQLINIENTYSNKNINTSKIFEKGITEKKNHSGMGLWEVKQILKRTKNAKLITSNDENYFRQHLEIYY